MFQRLTAFLSVIFIAVSLTAATAADRERVAAFVAVTGYDVMLESLGPAARSAPALLGLDENAFGETWKKLSDKVFAPDDLRKEAIDILAATLSDDLLSHGAAFYASPLGQRLVEAENTAHMADNEMQRQEGAELVSRMLAEGSARPALFEAMRTAIGSEDASLNAWVELQVRFVTAAVDAGIVTLRVSPAELRARLEARRDEMKAELAANTLASSAWTYRAFSDQDLQAYVNALETDEMKLIYQLLFAVQFELQVTRYEELAGLLAKLYPGEDL